MARAKLSSKSQIVLPAEFRRRLGLSAGDVVEVEVEGDRIIIKKAQLSSVERLEKLASSVWKGYEKELLAERDRWND